MIKKFTDLEIWQAAHALGNKANAILNQSNFTPEEALKEQANKSAGSIADNIAAGFGKGDNPAFIQYLQLSKASAFALQSQLMRCCERQYISKEIRDELVSGTDNIVTKIDAFISHLQPATKADSIPTDTLPHDVHPEVVSTLHAARPLGAYPHARKAGNLLFLSGIGPRQAADNSIPGLVLDAEGNIVTYDIEAECHAVFANVKAVLEASGSCWENMIDVTVFLTHMKKDFEIYNKIYGHYFQGINACRTTVEVKSLPTPIAIELKVIATL